MFCARCGTSNDNGAGFCHSCGAPLGSNVVNRGGYMGNPQMNGGYNQQMNGGYNQPMPGQYMQQPYQMGMMRPKPKAVKNPLMYVMLCLLIVVPFLPFCISDGYHGIAYAYAYDRVADGIFVVVPALIFLIIYSVATSSTAIRVNGFIFIGIALLVTTIDFSRAVQFGIAGAGMYIIEAACITALVLLITLKQKFTY